MTTRRTPFRAIGGVGVCLAALVLVVPPASATVTANALGSFGALVTSDGAGDAMSLDCSGGDLRWVQGPQAMLPCADTTTITVNGNGGIDAIDLSALQPADFPILDSVILDGGDGADSIKGSFFGDDIEGDELDTIIALGGNDRINGGATVFGGDGNDHIHFPVGPADGGAGDDVFEGFGTSMTGGSGTDTVMYDFSDGDATGATVNFVITDGAFHADVQGTPTVVEVPITDVELYDMTLFDQGVQNWSSAAYSGSVDLKALDGVDSVVAGPGEDFLDTGGGNDAIVPGAGFDYVKAGPGDDTVDVRDGAVDRLICGDGTDTVTADYEDVLTGCENVSLPQPVTGAIRGPKKVKQGVKAKFTFTSSTPFATFQCKLDKKAWKACRSPFTVATKNLKASATGAKHVLRVRAVRSGVVDATPSKKVFKVVKAT